MPSTCDPNYDCVPIASDVDCAGGSGNGPAYVSGPVYVVGDDIYGLDGNDNDGVGCGSGEERSVATSHKSCVACHRDVRR